MYENKKLSYTIITNKKLKNLYITIDPSSGVIVKNPNYSLAKIQEIMDKKAKWIFEKSQCLQLKNSIKNIYEIEKKILLFGERQSHHVKGNLAQFYKEKSQDIIPPIVKKWEEIMQLKSNGIKFRKAKRRWGSCSFKNELSFNTSLVQLPLQCIEYIVVHELSHIKHKHHQKTFWTLVEEFMPHYKECERTIKDYSPQI
jgi:hypothetical protein